jgi:outer membrane protein
LRRCSTPASRAPVPRPMNLHRYAAIAAIATVLAAQPCVAQAASGGRRRITLAQALEIAAGRNRPLRAAELASESARDQVGVARGAMLPRLDAAEDYTNSNNPSVVFSNLLNQQDFGPNDFHLDRLNHPPSFSDFQSVIRLSQPIFAGGRLWASFRASRDAADAARWFAERQRQETIFAVTEAYYGAVLAEQRVGVIERALAAARAHRARAADLLAHGMVVKSDVLRTQVMVGSLEQELNQANNRLLTAWDAFTHTLGAEDEALAPLGNPPELSRPAALSSRSLEALVAAAIRARPEIKAAQSQVDQARQALRIARAEYLPSLGVAAAFENDSRDLARAGNSYTVFVTGRMNLFDGLATSAKVGAAEAEMRRTQELRDELVHGVALEVETAYHALQAAAHNVGVARRSEAYAAEALKILDDRYGSGLATNVEVLDAESAHKQAALRLSEAEAAVVVGRYALDLAAGSLDRGATHD